MATTRVCVVMLDRFRTEMAITFENQCVPYGRRLVTIELTDEQQDALVPRVVGQSGVTDRYEEIGDVWIESADKPVTKSCVNCDRTNCDSDSTGACPEHQEDPR